MSYFQFTFFYFPLSASLVGPFSDMAMGLPILCFSTSEALQTVSSFSEGLNWLNFFTFLLRRCVFQNLSNFWSVLKCKFQSRTHCVGFSPNSVEAIFLCLTQSIPIFSMELKWFFFFLLLTAFLLLLYLLQTTIPVADFLWSTAHL